jgi:hypothetical protein
MEWGEFWNVAWSRSIELISTESDQIRYGQIGVGYWFVGLVVAVVFLTLVRLSATARRHARSHSGFAVRLQHQRSALGAFLYNAPKLLLALAVIGVAIALADPFLTATQEITGDVESRVRIDLVDTSLSMAWEFPDTGKSRAQVAREAHLRFLEMRQDKNDRVSLWVFSSFPYMIDDFVIDDELYFFQVMEAPYATVKILAPQSGTSIDRLFIPPDKVRIIPSEGNTNINSALQAVVRHFDQDDASGGAAPGQHRAVLIITDAGVDEMPEDEFAQLSARNIVPYVIYINIGGLDGQRDDGRTTPPLLEMIQTHGGEYFDVTDERGILRAYEAIDEREAVRVEVSQQAQKVPIFPQFLLLSMALLVVSIPAGFVAELLWGSHP